MMTMTMGCDVILMMTCIEKEWRRAYLLLEMAPTDVTPMLLTALASYSSLGGKGGLMMVMVMVMVASIMTNYKVESCGHSECSKHFPLPFGIGAQAHHRTQCSSHNGDDDDGDGDGDGNGGHRTLNTEQCSLNITH